MKYLINIKNLTSNSASTAAIKYYEKKMGTLITENNRHIRTDVVMDSHRKYLDRSVNRVSTIP